MLFYIFMYIVLKWKYLDYIYVIFIIYRDGVLLDKFLYIVRNYYDYDVIFGKVYLYMLMVEYEDVELLVVELLVYVVFGICRGILWF